MRLDAQQHRYELVRHQAVYTRFEPALSRITIPAVGPLPVFMESLQARLDAKLGHTPDAPTLADVNDWSDES